MSQAPLKRPLEDEGPTGKPHRPSYDSDTLEQPPQKQAKHQPASQRHIQTEQRRRDRINEGFTAMQNLLPCKDKVEKATLLNQAVDHICQLQGVLKELLTSGAVHLLSEDLQWRIRQLMPHVTIAPKPKGHVPTPPPSLLASGVTSNGLLTQPVPNLALLASLLPQAAEGCVIKPAPEATAGTSVLQFFQQQQQQQQQALQAWQLQQALSQTLPQTGPQQILGELPALQALSTPPILPLAAEERLPCGQYVHDLPPTCGLHKLMDAASATAAATLPPRPTKAPRKNTAKVRRHTTAARLSKPDVPVGPSSTELGRPAPL